MLQGSKSRCSESLNYICFKYGVNRCDFDNINGNFVIDQINECVERKAALIADLIHLREQSSHDNDLISLIEMLCTE